MYSLITFCNDFLELMHTCTESNSNVIDVNFKTTGANEQQPSTPLTAPPRLCGTKRAYFKVWRITQSNSCDGLLVGHKDANMDGYCKFFE